MLNFLSLLKNKDIAHSITSLALGKFDGMHIAHFALFDRLDSGGAILCIESNKGELLPQKYRHLRAPRPIFYLPLEKVKNKSDKEFVRFLLEILPNLKTLVVGYDFRFGKDRRYYVFDLCKRFDGRVIVVGEVLYKKLSVHSGLIKELLINGNLKLANKLLGRMFGIYGSIVRGQGIGAKELVATINLKNDGFLLPKEGVYAGYVELLESLKKVAKNTAHISLESQEQRTLQGSHISHKYPAVIFIGNRLSTDKKFSIEAHLLGVKLNVTQKAAAVSLAKYLRENQRFESLSDLKEQIQKDIQKAQKALKIGETSDNLEVKAESL